MAEQMSEVRVTMSELKGILAEAIKDMDLPQIKALKEELAAVDRKIMFPDSDGTHAETCGKSIIDTRVFREPVSSLDGPALAMRLRSSGGPWVSLSKEMEAFAKIVACCGDLKRAESLGVSVLEYNEMVKQSYRKVLGEKALTTTDAGALVPVEYLATVLEFATAQSQILQRVWRLPMAGMTLKIPKLVQSAGSYFGGVVLYHPGEGGQKTETKPSFDQITLTAKKLIGLVNLTDELIMDSSINVVNYVTGLMVRAFQWQTEYEILRGTGTSDQMTGILTDASVTVVPRATAATVKYEDLINMESAIDENFQDLSWISRRATINTFRKQKDTAGAPIWHEGFQTALGAAMVPQLLGYPVIKTRNVPALGSKGDVILGDLGFYLWAVRQDMTIDTSRDYRFAYDETTLRFVVRQDGVPGVPEAFAVLSAATS